MGRGVDGEQQEKQSGSGRRNFFHIDSMRMIRFQEGEKIVLLKWLKYVEMSGLCNRNLA